MNGREECLEIVKSIVTKDRNSTYGNPEDNFKNIAAIQAVVDKCPDPVAKVALNAIATKLARLVNSPDHLDSWIDIAGYAACGYDVIVSRRVAITMIEKNTEDFVRCTCGLFPTGECDGCCRKG